MLDRLSLSVSPSLPLYLPDPRSLPPSQNEAGKVVGAQCVDSQSGESFNVYARAVVNATGCFADGLRKQAEGENTKEVRTVCAVAI